MRTKRAVDCRPVPTGADALMARIAGREAVVGVMGLGYVGLPLAVRFAQQGFRVLGYDVDAAKIARLEAGDSYIPSVASAALRAVREAGRFAATADPRRLGEPDALLIAVPTPLTPQREPDLRFVTGSAQAIAAVLRPGQLVVLESTTYPGTTDEVVRPILEAKGLRAGRDFFLAFSPEREDPGVKGHSIGEIPKVVGGDDPESARLVAALYAAVAPRVVPVSSTRAAEASKLLENIYRAVNIALVNELKILFDRMGIDVWEVIDAAATKPFGFQRFTPGPGWGGHCIPLDPFYLAWKAREYGTPTRFIELAGELNATMARWVTEKVADALNERGKAMKGAKLLLLGIAYKKDVSDERESPAFPLAVELQKKGAVLCYHDPHVGTFPKKREFPNLVLPAVPCDAATLAAQDAVVIVTDHSAVDYAHVVRHARLVVDTRNATAAVTEGRDKIVRA